jgi:hypothetical protein
MAQFRSSDPGKLQKIINELRHSLCRGPHPVQIVLPLFIQLARVILKQH